jgi:excisionase family DNA binding protein
MTRKTLSVEEAAHVLGIGRGSAYEAVRRGELPAIRIGKRLVVPRAALQRLLEAGRRPQDVA